MFFQDFHSKLQPTRFIHMNLVVGYEHLRTSVHGYVELKRQIVIKPQKCKEQKTVSVLQRVNNAN
jgi:hypothetical protein